jgi:hypothetical protein
MFQRLQLLLKIFFCLALAHAASAQVTYPKGDFINPLNIPLSLSGNFGELRNNHFHSGIDLRTNSEEGYLTVAVADGYVSRIKVSAFGYGNALYITHKNGYVSVYGHLLRFDSTIANYVKQKQYELESFEVEHALISIGRVPNVEDLNLEAAGVELNERGYVKEIDTQTTTPNIYVAGDLSANIALVNVGEREGRHAVARIYGKHVKPLVYTNISTIMFLNPEVASVGMGEQEAMEKCNSTCLI